MYGPGMNMHQRFEHDSVLSGAAIAVRDQAEETEPAKPVTRSRTVRGRETPTAETPTVQE